MADQLDPPVPQSLPSSQHLPMSASAPIMITAEALQVLLAQVRAIPAGVQPASVDPVPAQIAQTNPPPFHSIAAPVVPPGESLYDLFPFVETGAILDITKHMFKPLDLFRLDSALHDKSIDLKTTLDFENGSLSARARTGSPRDYPHLSSLIEPLSTYFNILSAYAASSGNVAATYTISSGGFQYIHHLSTLNRSYHWNAVLQYHKAFFMLHCRDMLKGDYSGWARSDSQLMNSHLYHQVRPLAHGQSRAVRSTSSPSKVLVASQICFSFNKGSCTASPCPSGRIHKCQTCDSPGHGSSSCSKTS